MKEILQANPDDAFARYALGLEYSGSGDTDAALAEFKRLLASIPTTLTHTSWPPRHSPAPSAPTKPAPCCGQGIDCARRTRNQHALSEMEAMLDELEAMADR